MTETAEARTASLRHLSGWAFAADLPRRLGVAVSGGGDSMALLDLMAWHADALGVPVHAVTVDHRLRPEAADEAAFVARHCAERGIPHETLLWEGWDGAGNLSASARDARYGLIAVWAQRHGIDRVALGHTADDVAETFLMRLGRAAGLDGLSAMESRFTRLGVTWIRPLHLCGRAELRAYLAERGIAWCEDPSNSNPAYARTRAREVLAALAPLGIDADTLSQVARNLGSARDALAHCTWKAAQGLVRQDRGDLVVKRHAVPPEPPEIHRRLLVAALQWVSGAGYPPRHGALANLDAAPTGTDRHTLCGCVVTRQTGKRPGDETLRITREWNAVKTLSCPTDALWDGRWRLSGPHAPELRIRALGEAVAQCPDWRDSGLPRHSLLASPAIWHGNDLIAAPLAGLCDGWTADLAETRCDFVASLL